MDCSGSCPDNDGEQSDSKKISKVTVDIQKCIQLSARPENNCQFNKQTGGKDVKRAAENLIHGGEGKLSVLKGSDVLQRTGQSVSIS